MCFIILEPPYRSLTKTVISDGAILKGFDWVFLFYHISLFDDLFKNTWPGCVLPINLKKTVRWLPNESLERQNKCWNIKRKKYAWKGNINSLLKYPVNNIYLMKILYFLQHRRAVWKEYLENLRIVVVTLQILFFSLPYRFTT